MGILQSGDVNKRVMMNMYVKSAVKGSCYGGPRIQIKPTQSARLMTFCTEVLNGRPSCGCITSARMLHGVG